MVAPQRITKEWDRHCPECGSDDHELLLVTRFALRRRCSGCGHRWWEEREGMSRDQSPNYINRKDVR